MTDNNQNETQEIKNERLAMFGSDFKLIQKTAIKTKLTTLIGKRKKIQEELHNIAMQCYGYAFVERDFVPFTTMYNALYEINKNEAEQLRHWMRKHTLARFSKDKEGNTKVTLDKKREEQGFEYNPSEAMAEPYYTIQNSQETLKYVGLSSMLKRLEGITKDIENVKNGSKKNTEIESNTDMAMLERLENDIKGLVGMYKSTQPKDFDVESEAA